MEHCSSWPARRVEPGRGHPTKSTGSFPGLLDWHRPRQHHRFPLFTSLLNLCLGPHSADLAPSGHSLGSPPGTLASPQPSGLLSTGCLRPREERWPLGGCGHDGHEAHREACPCVLGPEGQLTVAGYLGSPVPMHSQGVRRGAQCQGAVPSSPPRGCRAHTQGEPSQHTQHLERQQCWLKARAGLAWFQHQESGQLPMAQGSQGPDQEGARRQYMGAP